MLTPPLVLWIGNHMVIEHVGVRNTVTGVYDNAATVAVTLKDSAGVALTGETWPKTMSYVAGSNGVYRATLAATIAAVSGDKLRAHLAVQGSGGEIDYREIPVTARYRQID